MIERYHRNERKWAGIGYHFLVGHDGSVYEGRPASVQGAHVSRHNKQNLGISMIGDFDRQVPTSRQLATLHALLRDKVDQYSLSRTAVFGHRDLGNTVCPGKHLYTWLKKYKKTGAA